jgi:hypothetical protein
MRAPRKPRTQSEAEIQALAVLAFDADLTTLRTSPDAKPMSKAERRATLEALSQGEVVELDIDAVVYRQSKTERPLPAKRAKEANANFCTFRPKELPTLARTFKGRPLLRDHDRGSFDAVGGAITASSLEENGDWYEFRQTLHLVKPWLVRAALDGTLKTFSISWDPKKRGFAGFRDSVFCTVCNTKMFSSECQHWPGDVLDAAEGEDDGTVVEIEWRGVRGAETSAVSFPAVEGTAVEEIRAALAEARSDQPATDEVDTMADETKDLAKEVEDLKAELAASKEKLAEERATHAREAKERKTADVNALREKAIGDGLFVPGSGLAESFDDLAEISLEKAQNFVKSLSPSVPAIASPMQSGIAPAGPAADASEFDTLCESEYGMPEEVKERIPGVLKKLGLDEKAFVEHGPHTTWGRN